MDDQAASANYRINGQKTADEREWLDWADGRDRGPLGAKREELKSVMAVWVVEVGKGTNELAGSGRRENGRVLDIQDSESTKDGSTERVLQVQE